jgi:hypothetical protein
MTLEAQTQQNLQDDAAQPTSVDPASSAASPTASDAPARPEWLTDDTLFDPAKGVKLDELGAKWKEANEKLAEVERLSAERKANTPEKAEDYGIAFPEDYKMPEDFQVDENSPLWKTLQETALARGLTKAEYAQTAAAFVNSMAAAEQANAARIKDAQTELFKQLGDSGASRVDAVRNWMVAQFGDQVGQQLQHSLFTPDIVKAFESIQKVFTSQGVTAFNGAGRDSGRTDGKPDGWESMSPLDQRTWQLQQARGAGR